MPQFNIEARWTMFKQFKVEANDLSHAIDIVEQEPEYQPKEGAYLEDSWNVPRFANELLNSDKMDRAPQV